MSLGGGGGADGDMLRFLQCMCSGACNWASPKQWMTGSICQHRAVGIHHSRKP